MAQSTGRSGEGLSLQTLVIAAAASAVAAVVVSHFWRGGTVVAAAMTPVIVSIVKELLARPMESEIVRKPVQQVSRIASSRLVATASPPTERVRQAPRQLPEEPFEPAPLPPALEDRDTRAHEGRPDPAVLQSHPRRTYGGGSRRARPHLKLALITGLLAFVIAALVLTVPELVFGGAVSSHRSTTLFGGGSSSSAKKDRKQKDSEGGASGQSRQGGRTTPATPPPTTGTRPPATTAPAPTTPQATTPAPQAAPPPSSGGTTTPSP